ncbi:MFS transporter [Candidatus Marinimicrobia bacterium]|nr:MFS transporter [bacterium]MDA7641208.1 MFS transporter [Candidatus Neomarinimicrobiota bacterium]MDA7685768.1 MFS transporter [Candidatus Neomarinimicrobiota bacterium]MDB3883364.1 MFS transporter [Candidatus Neomarinimicrobiota bacterium]MDC0878494.1 MFS transporter [Candidatus Neomarinimicrobiota bacterium]|tara:strand:+ start:9112 stop:10398 length:1287 start_codon:yes stop_codon:yes gene_type:complete
MNQKKIYSWALYDWANSAFATTVMAGFFPIFFSQYWSDPSNLSISTFYLGLGNSLASIVVALLAPFLGAIADRGSYKKRFLIFFAFLGIVMTVGLGFVAQGMWPIALLVYIFATIGFSGANTFYDSLLPSVSNEQTVDYVSALGYSLGYLGGGILIVVNFLMLSYPESFGLANSTSAIQWSFISVGIWWALFSIPIMLFVEEERELETKSIADSIREGIAQFKSTFNEIKNLKVVATFLLAYWLYIDGVDTTVRMAANFGINLGFGETAIMGALVLVQFVAFFATLLYIKFSDKVGIKNGIYTAIFAYVFIVLGAFFVTEAWHFYILAVLIGCFQGGIQTLSRSLYSRIIPENKSGEFFGFFNMWGKFAAVFGPLIMGSATVLINNAIADQELAARIGFQSIIVLLLLGAYVFSKVDLAEGEAMAKKL